MQRNTLNKNEKNNDLSVVFTGDIAFSGYFKEKYADNEVVSSEIVKFMNDSDHVVANIECPITDRKIDSDRALNHVMNPKVVDLLQSMGIDIWNIGNNHVLDCKLDGLKDTLECSQKANVRTIGAGINKREAEKTLIIGNEVKVGIISVVKEWNHLKSNSNAPGCIYFTDYETIKKQVEYLRPKVNYIVAIVHGGDEFASMPMPYDRKNYIKLLDFGIDIIVAHHPHVVQNYEIIKDKIIFYSLGNFIFDTDYQRIQKHSEYGILLKLHFGKNGYTWKYLPIFINRESNRIDVGECPKIFTNIDKKQYSNLWPIVAKQFTCNDKKAKEFKDPSSRKKSKLKIIKSYLGRYRHKKSFIVEVGGKILYPIKRCKKIDKELYSYVVEKM
ncbi:MAG: CapA family protein [Clostridia bacterium]|nr:CapA family protein [Clostridia bacterium]